MTQIKSKKVLDYLERLAPEIPVDAAELQALKKEIERCKSIFESIRDASLKTTTGNVSHQKAHIIGMASRMVELLTKKLTEK